MLPARYESCFAQPELNLGILAGAGANWRLAQLVDLMYLGDWVSLYLAFDAGVDPGPIDAIARLKAELAR